VRYLLSLFFILTYKVASLPYQTLPQFTSLFCELPVTGQAFLPLHAFPDPLSPPPKGCHPSVGFFRCPLRGGCLLLIPRGRFPPVAFDSYRFQAVALFSEPPISLCPGAHFLSFSSFPERVVFLFHALSWHKRPAIPPQCLGPISIFWPISTLPRNSSCFRSFLLLTLAVIPPSPDRFHRLVAFNETVDSAIFFFHRFAFFFPFNLLSFFECVSCQL